MNYSTISEFADILSKFGKDFEKYTKTLNKLGGELEATSGVIQRFDDMTLEDYYYDIKVQNLLGQPVHQAALAAMTDQESKDNYRELLKSDVITKEPFSDLSAEKVAKYEEDLEELRSLAHNSAAVAEYDEVENKTFKERRDFDKVIDNVASDVDSIKAEFEDELEQLQSEKNRLINKYNRRMKSIASNDVDKKKELSEEIEKEKTLLNRKIRLYTSALSLCSTFKNELSNIKESNKNLEFVFNENVEMINALSSKINSIKTVNIDSAVEVEKAAIAAEEIANKVDGIKSRSIVIDFVKNDDNTYDIFIEKGKMLTNRKGLKAEDLTAEYIQKMLGRFAEKVAANTKDLTVKEIINSTLPVIIKENGVEKNRELFEDVGKSVVNGFANVHNAPQADGPQTDGPQADGPQTDGPQADGPQADGPQTDGPQTDGPQADGPQTDGPQTDGPQTDGPQAVIDPVLDRCFQVRAAREAGFKRVKDGLTTIGTVAAVGLGLLVGPEALMFAGVGAGALVAGVNIVEKAGNVMDKLRQASVKHKLNKTAKKFGLKVDYNYENGTIKFVAQDGNDKVAITSLHDSASDLQQELDRQFNYINSPKKNSGFESFPRVTLDNLEASFIEFGGLQTKKEREDLELKQNSNGWKFLTDNILRRNSKALEEEKSDAEAVDLEEAQGLGAEIIEEPVAAIDDPSIIDAQVVDGRAVDVEQMTEAMEDSEGLTPDVLDVENPAPDVADVVSDYDSMFDDLDNAGLDVNGVIAPSDEEIVTALTNNSLDKQTAIDYITQAEDLNNDLVIEMVESGIITQDEIDSLWETRENNQARSLA